MSYPYLSAAKVSIYSESNKFFCEKKQNAIDGNGRDPPREHVDDVVCLDIDGGKTHQDVEGKNAEEQFLVF